MKKIYLFIKEIVQRQTIPFLSLILMIAATFIGVFLTQNRQEIRKRAAGNTYYVALTGNDDTNPGTIDQPWKTIQKAADTMVAGDTVIVNAGNYAGDVSVFNKIRITRSGTSGMPITYQASGVVLTQGFLVPADYITIKGFDIEDPHDSRIKNSTESDYRGGTGVFVEGNNVIIEDNYIHGCVWGGIILNKNGNFLVPSNSVVRNNRLFRNGQEGILVSGRNNLIEGNEIWATIQHHPGNILSATVTWLDADGIRFFGQGHIIRKNYIHDIKFGAPGINLDSNDPNNIYNLNNDYNDDPHIDCFQTWSSSSNETASNILFEQNFCDNAQSNAINENGSGFMIQGTPGQLGLTHPTNLTIRNNILKAYGGINATDVVNLQVYNNIFSGDLSLPQAFYPMGVSLGNVQYPLIKNNIFYNQNYHTLNIPNQNPNINSNIYNDADIDYNAFYNSDGSTPDCIRINDYVCRTQTARELWGANPLFVNPTGNDFHLQATSPVIDKGANLGTLVTNDYEGTARPQGNGYDIGTYEYTSGSLPGPTGLPTTFTPTPTSAPIPTPSTNKTGDINGDGKVDEIDYAGLIAHFGQTGTPGQVVGDLNKDGKVDEIDYAGLIANFGR